MCLALTLKGEQCLRKNKKGSDYCSTHYVNLNLKPIVYLPYKKISDCESFLDKSKVDKDIFTKNGTIITYKNKTVDLETIFSNDRWLMKVIRDEKVVFEPLSLRDNMMSFNLNNQCIIINLSNNTCQKMHDKCLYIFKSENTDIYFVMTGYLHNYSLCAYSLDNGRFTPIQFSYKLDPNDECKGPFIIKKHYTNINKIYIPRFLCHAMTIEQLKKEKLNHELYSAALTCKANKRTIEYIDRMVDVRFSNTTLYVDAGLLSSLRSSLIDDQVGGKYLPGISSHEFIKIVNCQINYDILMKADYLNMEKETLGFLCEFLVLPYTLKFIFENL